MKSANQSCAPRPASRRGPRAPTGDLLCSLAIVLAGVAGNLMLWNLVTRCFG